MACPRGVLSYICQKSLLADDLDESKCPARDVDNSAFAGLCLACGADSSGIQANRKERACDGE